jgi:hypothetical protein
MVDRYRFALRICAIFRFEIRGWEEMIFSAAVCGWFGGTGVSHPRALRAAPVGYLRREDGGAEFRRSFLSDFCALPKC